MNFSNTIYCETEENLKVILKELTDNGYNIKKGTNSRGLESNYWHCTIDESIVQRKGKCGFCGSLIDSRGIFAHNRKCEVCGKVVYLEYKSGDLIRFSFRGDQEFWSDVTLQLYKIDMSNRRLIFYKVIPKQLGGIGAKTEEQILEKLEKFKGCYDIVKLPTRSGATIEFYSFVYDMSSFLLADDCHINISESRGSDTYASGFKNSSVVNVYQGKEYSEFERLPIHETITVYEDWKIQKTAAEILSRNRMSSRPEYYSGRGATLSDLNSEILEGIFNDIVKYYGKEAGDNFVLMVKEMPEMSATDFIKTLYRLERNEWKWDSRLISKKEGRGISFDDEIGAIGTLMGAMFRGKVDQTSSIRNVFLRKHGIKPTSTRVMTEYGSYYEVE